MRERMKMVQALQNGAMADPSGTLTRKKVGTGKRMTPQERARAKKDRERELRKRKREGKEKSVDPNAACPCGSGKKSKDCCGRGKNRDNPRG
jgi:uncharacterized protein YchJ